MRKQRLRLAALAIAATGALSLSAASAGASSFSTPVDGLVGPLQFAVGSSGTLYVGQSFAGQLTATTSKGTTTLVTVPGGEVAGVAAEGNGTLTYTASAGTEEEITSAGVYRVTPNGRTTQLADTLAYEQANNPDQVNTYGFTDLTPDCAAQIPTEIPNDYTGQIDSHPYAVAIGSDGSRYVADAGGNDILRVAANGTITTVAVLPPIPLTITADIAAGVGLPDCTIGHDYAFEPVPTDVEVGPNGLLYVSSLPGGPEGPELGARGSVFTVNPTTGATTQIATGFAGATNVAVTPDGTVYVAEMFGNVITGFTGSSRWTAATVDSPAAVEWANGTLYASVNVFASGSIVTIPTS